MTQMIQTVFCGGIWHWNLETRTSARTWAKKEHACENTQKKKSVGRESQGSNKCKEKGEEHEER